MPFSRTLVIGLTVVLFGLVLIFNMAVDTEQQFSYLAQSFASGELFFLEEPGSWGDTVAFHGRHYWPLGPLPSILLLPFVFVAEKMGIFFRQGYLQPLLVMVVFWLCVRIARRLGYSRNDGICLGLGFTFATAFLGVAMWPWSWYFSQVITVLLVFAAIDEFSDKRRYWRIGIFFGLALACRVSAALGIAWIVLETLWDGRPPAARIKSLAQLAVPCAVVLALLLAYNAARFDDPFEQGYSMQSIPDHAATARAYGTFSPLHLPGNLYYLFVSAPVPVLRDDVSQVLKFPWVAANPWGMSMLVTSPCLLFLLGLSYRDRTSRLLILTVVLIALPILLYYGVGFRQFGYRYSLDFLPLLFFLLMRNYREQRGDLSPALRGTILVSAIVNLYLFVALFSAPLWR